MDRSERYRRWAVWTAIPVLFILATFFIFRPSQYVGEVRAIVARSTVSIDAYGGKHHELYVKLDDDRTVLVNAMSMRPLKNGQQVTLTKRTHWTGSTFYQLDLGRPPQPRQSH